VADPYATRKPDLSGRPDVPPPWQEEVTGRGGAMIAPEGVWEVPPQADAPGFLVVACCGVGTLAPFASVDPAMAVLLWLEHVANPRTADAANRLLLRLEEFYGPVFAIKQGAVGGPADRPGCIPVSVELVSELIAGRDAIAWERDPDFGYEVPASVPGFTDPAARALMPRLLYADNDRVYEHAELVADKKRERSELAASIPGLDPTVASIVGWPPRVTSDDWRD
jgi:hypothetical protein